GQIDALAWMLELELDAVSGGPRPHAHLATERRGQGVLGRSERILEVGVDDDRPGVTAPAGAVFDLARAPLGLADRPGLRARLTRQPEPLRLVLDEQERASVASRQLARLDHRERLVGQLEHPDQVGNGDAASPDAPADLLLRDPEVLDERGTRTGFLDRV